MNPLKGIDEKQVLQLAEYIKNAELFSDAAAKTAAKETLDMSHAARMERAKAMGFDTDNPVYHGTATDFSEFDPDRSIGTQYWSTNDKAAIESGDVGAQGNGVIKALYHRVQNPAGWDEYDKFGIDELISRGYDGVKLPESDGTFSLIAFDPAQYRSVNAAFDPAKKDSANLMASVGGAAIVGGSMLTANEAEAYQDEDLSQAYIAASDEATKQQGLAWLDQYKAMPAPVSASKPEATNWIEWTYREGSEAAKAAYNGAATAVKQMRQTGKELEQSLNDMVGANVFDKHPVSAISDFLINNIPEAERSGDVGDSLIEGMSQFLTAFIGPNKALKGMKFFSGSTKSAEIGRSMLAGGFADFAAFDPHEGRLADFLQELGVKNDFIDWLAAEEDDTAFQGRVKNAMEGAGLGVATEVAGKAFRMYKTWYKASKDGKVLKNLMPNQLANQLDVSPHTPVERVNAMLGEGDNLIDIADVTDDQVATFIQGTEIKDKAININMSRLNSADDIQKAIMDASAAFTSDIDAATRGRISIEQSAALADDMGMSVADLLKRNSGEAFNAEQAIAARKIMASSGQRLSELARAASGSQSSPETLVAFRQALAVHGAIQAQVSGMTAEAGRALSSFRYIAGAGDDLLDANSVLDAVEAAGGDKGLKQMATRLLMLQGKGLNKAARELTKPGMKDMFYEIWINGLLSSPATHAVNAMGNALTAAWQIPERYLAAGVGKMRGAQNIPFGEGSHQMYGMARGFREGFSLAWDAIKTGEPSDPITKIEVSAHKAITASNIGLRSDTSMGKGVDLLGDWAVRLPGRFLTAGDELFKAVGYRMELNARAYRTAVKEGLSGDDMARRIQDLVENTPADLKADAIDMARYQTFQNELGAAGKAVQSFANNAPMAKLVMPFVRTPVNIAKFVGQRTPLGFMSKNIREAIKAGGAEGDLALARMGLGTMIMGSTAAMVQEGMITGSGPADRNVNAMWRAAGHQPHSIRVGDTYYSYNRMDPIGMLMGLTADAVEIAQYSSNLDDVDMVDAGAAVGLATINNLTSKTYLSGVAELFKVLGNAQTDPEASNKYAKAYLTRLATSFSPATSLSGQLTRTIDPTLREASGIVERLRSRTPGLSSDLPPRRNLFGDPIQLEGGLGWDFVSPLYTSTIKKDDAVVAHLLENQISIGKVNRQINGIELSTEEYDRFTLLAAGRNDDGSPSPGMRRTLKDEMSRQIERSAYVNETDGPEGGKALIMQTVARKYREYAKDQMLKEFPDLAEKYRGDQLRRVEKLRR